MKYKYLVANPFGVFLVRCKNMKEVRDFIHKHASRCKDAYALLTGEHLEGKHYQVRDLEEIPSVDQIEK